MGLFGRIGCSRGSCHGSFQGKGGFRLSLFGYDPEKDFQALTPRGQRPPHQPRPTPTAACCCSRRPARSSTAARRASPGIPGNTAVPRMDRPGARLDARAAAQVKSISVTPAGIGLRQSRRDRPTRQSRPPSPTAAEEDITPLLRLPHQRRRRRRGRRPSARSRRCRPGDTAVVVSYRGNVLPVRVLVPDASCRRASAIRRLPEVNYIDREVFAKLRRLNMVPSDLCQRRRVPAPRHHRHHRHAADARRRSAPSWPTQRAGQARHARSTSCWPIRCTPPCGRPSSATSPATTPIALEKPQQQQAEAQPDVARLVPQAHRREHAL